MWVKIRRKIFDTEVTPIMLIFENDMERKRVAKLLTNMEPRKNCIRKFVMFPESVPASVVAPWMQKI